MLGEELMKITHEYIATQLRPYLALAEEMDDVFPAYALSMLLEHCDDVILNREPPLHPPSGRPSYRIRRTQFVVGQQ
jgi:hypothetical protein